MKKKNKFIESKPEKKDYQNKSLSLSKKKYYLVKTLQTS